jgi:methyl-accepting chemotaxis protein
MSASVTAPLATGPARAQRHTDEPSGRFAFGIRTKIIAGFGMIVLITAAVGLLNLYNLAQVGSLSDTVYEDRVVPIRDLSQVRADLAETDGQTLRAIADASGSSLFSAQSALQRDGAEIERLIAGYEQVAVSEDEHRAVLSLRGDSSQYQDAIRGVLAALAQSDTSGALRLYTDRAAPLVSKLNGDLAYLIAFNDRLARAADDETGATYRRSLALTIPLLLMAIVLSAVVGLVLSGRIASTVVDVTRAARSLARGELHQQIQSQSSDELGTMAEALRDMMAYQRRMA